MIDIFIEYNRRVQYITFGYRHMFRLIFFVLFLHFVITCIAYFLLVRTVSRRVLQTLEKPMKSPNRELSGALPKRTSHKKGEKHRNSPFSTASSATLEVGSANGSLPSAQNSGESWVTSLAQSFRAFEEARARRSKYNTKVEDGSKKTDATSESQSYHPPTHNQLTADMLPGNMSNIPQLDGLPFVFGSILAASFLYLGHHYGHRYGSHQLCIFTICSLIVCILIPCIYIVCTSSTAEETMKRIRQEWNAAQQHHPQFNKSHRVVASCLCWPDLSFLRIMSLTPTEALQRSQRVWGAIGPDCSPWIKSISGIATFVLRFVLSFRQLPNRVREAIPDLRNSTASRQPSEKPGNPPQSTETEKNQYETSSSAAASPTFDADSDDAGSVPMPGFEDRDRTDTQSTRQNVAGETDMHIRSEDLRRMGKEIEEEEAAAERRPEVLERLRKSTDEEADPQDRRVVVRCFRQLEEIRDPQNRLEGVERYTQTDEEATDAQARAQILQRIEWIEEMETERERERERELQTLKREADIVMGCRATHAPQDAVMIERGCAGQELKLDADFDGELDETPYANCGGLEIVNGRNSKE